MPRWEQALHVDDIMAQAVIYGGLRRAARMAAKTWRDADAPRLAAGLDLPGHAGAAYALLVDADFWARLSPRAKADDLATLHARAVFEAASQAIHQRGEPGFINADRLVRTALPDVDASFGSARFPIMQGAALVSDIAIHARGADFPTITNPCGEVALPITGGFAWWRMWRRCWLALCRLKHFHPARCPRTLLKPGMRVWRRQSNLGCAF